CVVSAPSREDLVKQLEDATEQKFRLLLAPPSEVRRTIDQSYKALADVAHHIKEFELTSTPRVEADPALQQAVDQNAPIVQVVNLVLTQALRDRASDVHIE